MIAPAPPDPALANGRFRRLGARLTNALDPGSGRWLAAALMFVSIGGLAAGLAPLALKSLIDRLAPAPIGFEVLPTDLVLWIGLYAGALLFQRLCEQLQTYAYSRGEQRLTRRFAGQTYDHVLRLPLAFHLDHKSGALAQSLSEGVLGLRLILTHLVLSVAPVAVQLVVAGFVLHAVFGPALGLVLFLALAAYGLVFAWGVFRIHGAMRGVSAAQIDVGGATADGLINIEAIKAFTAEHRFARRYDDLLGQTERHWRTFLGRRLENGLAVAVVFALAVAAVHGVAAAQVGAGAVTLGGFVLINTYVLQLVRPLETLGFAIRDMGQGLAYLDAVARLLTQPREADHDPAASELVVSEPARPSAGPARLTFEAVGFDHGAGPTLQDLSFTLEPGALVGVVGPSGAGKTSLLRLILRFHTPRSGRILLDERPLNAIPLSDLRRQIALVAQDTVLLNDTIGANIALGDETADRAAIRAAADRARLSDLIARLPDGLDTRVGERGLKLSGGEKQRVSIARAALRRARLVIFDEATAALDPETERGVWRAMRGLGRDATLLAVTHRLSTVAEADLILVLDGGRLVESGRHAALMAQDGLYARLWRTQAAGAAAGEDRPTAE